MKGNNVIGAWAFLIGVLLAIVIGLAGLLDSASGNTWLIVMVILGIVIGLLNITNDEAERFMIAGTVLVIVSALGSQFIGLIPYFSAVIQALVILFVPATIIVALKAVFSLAKK